MLEPQPGPSSMEDTLIVNNHNEAIQLPLGTFTVGDYTWEFRISRGNIGTWYRNAFIDPFGDAALIIPNYNPNNTYTAYLPIYFRAAVIINEAQELATLCVYEAMRTGVVWLVVVGPAGSQLTNVSMNGLVQGFREIIEGNPPVNEHLINLRIGVALCPGPQP